MCSTRLASCEVNSIMCVCTSRLYRRGRNMKSFCSVEFRVNKIVTRRHRPDMSGFVQCVNGQKHIYSNVDVVCDGRKDRLKATTKLAERRQLVTPFGTQKLSWIRWVDEVGGMRSAGQIDFSCEFETNLNSAYEKMESANRTFEKPKSFNAYTVSTTHGLHLFCEFVSCFSFNLLFYLLDCFLHNL